MFLFVLFFALFPRDQSFYVLLVISSSLYLNTMVKIIYHEPHLYVINPGIKAPFCSHVSGLAFSFPSYPCMLQVCFDFSMYLIVFHTNKPERQQPVRTSNQGSESEMAFIEHQNNAPRDEQTILKNMMQRLDRTNDIFENDLMMMSSRRLKNRVARFCCHHLKKVFFILVMLFFSLL